MSVENTQSNYFLIHDQLFLYSTFQNQSAAGNVIQLIEQKEKPHNGKGITSYWKPHS